MAREVVWTDPAWEDLEAAAEYIARDSESYAAAFVQEIKDAAASLSEMAERGQIVPELRDASIRELLVRPYPSSTDSTHRKSRSLPSSTGPGGHGEFSRGPQLTARWTGPWARIRPPRPVAASVWRTARVTGCIGGRAWIS